MTHICTNCQRVVAPGTRTDEAGNHQYCLSADRQAFAACNHALARDMAWRLHRIWEGAIDWDEAIAVVHLSLCKACIGYRPDTGWRLSAYLTRIAAHDLQTAARKERSHRGLSLDYLPPEAGENDTPAAREWLATKHAFPDLDTQDECERLAEKLARIPDARQRQAVSRKYLDGWLLRQIGEELGVTRERARQIVLAGMRWLKREMGATA